MAGRARVPAGTRGVVIGTTFDLLGMTTRIPLFRHAVPLSSGLLFTLANPSSPEVVSHAIQRDGRIAQPQVGGQFPTIGSTGRRKDMAGNDEARPLNRDWTVDYFIKRSSMTE
jgi:hypothetical protein